MISLYVYVGTGFLAGIVCERWRARWRILLAMAGVAAVILHDTWPYLGYNKDRILETLCAGVAWNLMPMTLVFVGPFVIGLYGRRLARVIVRWRKREA
ncbi:MAG TPA: hypothetical protein VFB49_09510 [Patescibacteria group bacterium]|nr:hypothetical protein [Patescibacteria group bacterium]